MHRDAQERDDGSPKLDLDSQGPIDGDAVAKDNQPTDPVEQPPKKEELPSDPNASFTSVVDRAKRVKALATAREQAEEEKSQAEPVQEDKPNGKMASPMQTQPEGIPDWAVVEDGFSMDFLSMGDEEFGIPSGGGESSAFGAYEDLISDADFWLPGETHMQVAVFQGSDPKTIRSHSDERFEVCFNIHENPPTGDELVEQLKEQYGGGMFRIRFYEERAGKNPGTYLKRTLLIPVEEDVVVKQKRERTVADIERMRLQHKQKEWEERKNFHFENKFLTHLLMERQQPKEDQSVKFMELLVNMQQSQLEQQKKEAQMKEEGWLAAIRDMSASQSDQQRYLWEQQSAQQQQYMQTLNQQEEKMNPIFQMMMFQQQQDRERQREERRQDEIRRQEERDREERRQERERQWQQQQQQQQQMMMQMVMQTMSANKGESSSILAALASSPVLAKILEKPAPPPADNSKNEMMQVLLPILTDSKKTAEERSREMEHRFYQMMQKSNDPMSSMQQMSQMFSMFQGFSKMFNPALAQQDENNEDKDDENKKPAWLDTVLQVTNSAGLGRVAEAVASRWLAPPPPQKQLEESNQPRPARTPPAAGMPYGPPPGMPPMQMPPMGPPPNMQIPQNVQQQGPPPPGSPPPGMNMPPMGVPGQPPPGMPPGMPPMVNPPGVPGGPGPEMQNPGGQAAAAPSAPPPPPPKEPEQEIPNMSLSDVMNTKPDKQVQELFRGMESSIEPGTDEACDPEFFVTQKLGMTERIILKALLPTKSDAMNYIRKWAVGDEYPQINSMRGTQWLNRALTKLYS